MLFLKRSVSIALAFFIFILCAFSFTACSGEEGKKQDFLESELDEIKEYIEIGKYKGLDVFSGDESPDRVIWKTVEKNFTLKEYPAAQVEYYRAQLETEYRYHARKDGKTEGEIDAILESSEADILAEAKALTKSDLVYAAIVKLENISISEDESEKFFDKYVEKYVSVYGYNAEYVKENMADDIYSSMLYDKTTEFLLTNNNIK